jgi:hypothetical protein
MAAFPTVKTISPWNEVNHFTQGTSRDPQAPPRLHDKWRQLCPGCTIVVGRRARPGRQPARQEPDVHATTQLHQAFRSFLKTPRTICGIHNYSDVNRFRSTGTKALMKALGCKQYWLTETGGLYKFGSFWSRRRRRLHRRTPRAS